MKIIRDATYVKDVTDAMESGKKWAVEKIYADISTLRSELPKSSSTKYNLLGEVLKMIRPNEPVVWRIPRRKIGGQTVEKVIPDMGEIGGSDGS
jgi:hypothetical protein